MVEGVPKLRGKKRRSAISIAARVTKPRPLQMPSFLDKELHFLDPLLLLVETPDANPGCTNCVLCVKAHFAQSPRLAPRIGGARTLILSVQVDCLKEPPPLLFPPPWPDAGAANVARPKGLSPMSAAQLAAQLPCFSLRYLLVGSRLNINV